MYDNKSKEVTSFPKIVYDILFERYISKNALCYVMLNHIYANLRLYDDLTILDKS
jgi:hypothetical protein